MYLNKIDDLIEKILNDFNATILTKNKAFEKIIKEPNFVKYQKEINDIMSDYNDKLDISEIKKLVKTGDAINAIRETIKRYLAICLFLTIGYNYTSKDDTYINNIVEFSKNQFGYKHKIDNFFNSESNSIIAEYFNLMKNIITILNADSAKINMLKTKPDYRRAMEFLNELGAEIVTMLKGEKLSDAERGFNIIKIIIIRKLYLLIERKEFFKLLEIAEGTQGEYMFIDIVVPTKRTIDYGALEGLLEKKDIMRGLANVLWEYLVETNENTLKFVETIIDEKIKIGRAHV